MEGNVSHLIAGPVLKASTHVREEICGAVKQKIEHSGLEHLTDEQLEARLRATLERLPQQAGPTELTAPKEGAGPGLEGEPK